MGRHFRESKQASRGWIAIVVVFLVVAALLLGAVLVISFISAHFRGEVPRIGKYSVMHIISESMEPTIEQDTYVLIKRVPPEDVKKGDVICFYSTDPAIYGRPNTHRVDEEPFVENGVLTFITKGDRNPVADTEPATADRLIGVWVTNLDTLTAFPDFVTQNFIWIFALLVALGTGATVASLFLGAKKPREEATEEQAEEK